MTTLLLILVISMLSIVKGQQCQARLNRSISGQCSPVNNCQGTVLEVSTCLQQQCCIPGEALPTAAPCITDADFNIRNNTARAAYLRTALNYGIYAAGICTNCQAKAAFLAIAAAMTNNFQTDETSGTNAYFAADDTKYGNTQPGDGSLFRRRGLFGIRGRAMYQKLQQLMPQYQSVINPELAAIVPNAAVIASRLWTNPDLATEPALTGYADGSFYGFSMLWYKLTGDIDLLTDAAKHYSTFLRQLKCGGDLYTGQGQNCSYNATHQGFCSADCIHGLEDSSAFCGCSGPKGPQCPNSPPHIRCCLDTCSQELKMDLGFVLDASGSIGTDNYQLQLQFTKELLRLVNVGRNKTHVGIINFSTAVQTLTWLNTDYTLDEKLRKVDNATYYSGGTDTALGLQTANTVFSYSNGRRSVQEGATPVLFVITDGESDDSNATIKEANVLKQQDIIVISVGVGSGPNIVELQAMCTPPASENYFAISDYTALAKKLNQFTSKSCSEPVVVSPNATLTATISKDKYKFLKVEIDAMGNKILLTVKLLGGNVKLFSSFTNRNPKDPADFTDYQTKLVANGASPWIPFKSLVKRSSPTTGMPKSSPVTLTIDKPNTDVKFAYIGIKGTEDNNRFEVRFDDCSKTVCRSNASIMSVNIALISMYVFFLRRNTSQ